MKRALLPISFLVIASLACGLTGLTSPSQTDAGPTPQTAPTLVVDTTKALPPDGSLQALYQNVLPGVVAVRTDQGLGSGFVYDGEGHIVTNQHVVEGASTFEIAFSSGFKANGTVIGSDNDADIAVIKVDAPASELHPLPIGDSSTLQVGAPVVAIGNPFGLSGTMTTGIISGLGRTSPAHADPTGGYFLNADIIQTDAAINPGNSGGPLFDLNSEVIGINESILTNNTNSTGQPTNSGVGFAISINLVKKIVPSLIQNGSYKYPYLGLASTSDLSLAEVQAVGLNTFKGAYVTSVTPGGPADKAGIKAGTTSTQFNNLNAGGDLIVAFDGKPIDTFDQLLSYLITTKSPGDTVTLTIVRNGQQMDVPVTLGERPQ
jgi:S1-C subfamily serine protease